MEGDRDRRRDWKKDGRRERVRVRWERRRKKDKEERREWEKEREREVSYALKDLDFNLLDLRD